MKSAFKSLIIVLILFLPFLAKSIAPQSINSLNLKPMPMDGWRFGGGFGYAFYQGSQNDHKITRNYGEFNELRLNLTLAAFKQLNEENEWGLALKFGSFQTLNENTTEGFQCDFQELQSIWQHSLNDNIALNGKRYTINVQYGFGVMYYKSMNFAIDHNSQSIDYVISSVGYGLNNTTDWKGDPLTNIPNKKLAVVGNLGLNLGLLVSRNFSIYFENSLQISTTNKLSGKLVDVSKIPPDGYFYSGFSFFYRFGMAGGRISCPRL